MSSEYTLTGYLFGGGVDQDSISDGSKHYRVSRICNYFESPDRSKRENIRVDRRIGRSFDCPVSGSSVIVQFGGTSGYARENCTRQLAAEYALGWCTDDPCKSCGSRVIDPLSMNVTRASNSEVSEAKRGNYILSKGKPSIRT